MKKQAWNKRSKKYVLFESEGKAGISDMKATPFEGVAFCDGTTGEEHKGEPQPPEQLNEEVESETKEPLEVQPEKRDSSSDTVDHPFWGLFGG